MLYLVQSNSLWNRKLTPIIILQLVPTFNFHFDNFHSANQFPFSFELLRYLHKNYLAQLCTAINTKKIYPVQFFHLNQLSTHYLSLFIIYQILQLNCYSNFFNITPPNFKLVYLIFGVILNFQEFHSKIKNQLCLIF